MYACQKVLSVHNSSNAPGGCLMFSRNELDELLQCFLAESVEHLEGIEPLLLQLEGATPEEQKKLTNHVFRAAHSIKGSSGMFGFTHIHELSHKAESLLDLIRAGRAMPDGELVDLLLRSFDCLRNLVDNAIQSNTIDISEILKDLDRALDQLTKKSGTQLPVVPAPENCDRLPAWPAPSLFALPVEEIKAAQKELMQVYFARLDLIRDIDRRNKSFADFMKLLSGLGSIMAIEFDFDAFTISNSPPEPVLPAEILYNSVIGQNEIDEILEVPGGTFRLLTAAGDAVKQPIAALAGALAGLPPDSAAAADNKQAVAAANPAEPANAAQQPGIETLLVQEKAEPTLRVKVSLLEDLMNLAGELVLSRNQLREGLNRNDMRAIRISGQRMGQVTSELQETIMMTRLQPLDRVFSKFPRMIRDLSKQLHKDIHLTMEGKEVELDKTLIEGLGDPLTHMVRNAVDHGVETIDERARLGKPNPARVKLQAFYEASRVVIEISDDGRGIDGDKVCSKAVEKGLISPEKARNMPLREKQNLIFLPGLSTAEKVSELSGRGVGMDVVKANIDRLGGKVEINSELGRGTSFKIKLPLTLAIIPSLILESSREMFAIPQVNVLEMLLIPAEMIKRKIEVIGSQEVLILRGKLLPLISLNTFLGDRDSYVDDATGETRPERRQRLADRRSPKHNLPVAGLSLTSAGHEEHPRGKDRRFHAASGINVIVVTTGNFSYGIVVDKPLYTEEIVVKQLGSDLKGLAEYSGATILGDGRIALIIDVLGLAGRAAILNQQNSLAAGMSEQTAESRQDGDTVPFLVFRYGGPEVLALPLFLVSRLEKVSMRDVVSVGGWKAIKHGDRLLPVFFLSDLGRIEPLKPDQEYGVIVIRVRNREIGLIAALPIQVVEMRPDFDPTVLKQPGIGGSKVWNLKSMLLVDIWEILSLVRPELLEFDYEAAFKTGQANQIMLLEPVSYYRNQLRLQLENHGFSVVEAESWKEAETLLLRPPERLRAIFSDLTLLKQEGLESLRRLRKKKNLSHLQIVATRTNGHEEHKHLENEGIAHVFQKMENQHLPAWLEEMKTGAWN